MVDFLILMPLSLDSLDSETGMNSLMVSLLEEFQDVFVSRTEFQQCETSASKSRNAMKAESPKASETRKRGKKLAGDVAQTSSHKPKVFKGGDGHIEHLIGRERRSRIFYCHF